MAKENLDATFFSQVNLANLMLLSTASPKPVDVLFFHGRSFGDDTGLFELASAAYQSGLVACIALPNTEGERFGSNIPFEANPGKTEYIRRLTRLGIPNEKIKYPPTLSYHTYHENITFLSLSQTEGWTSGIILTQPHQLLRAMLGKLKAMEKQSYQMEVYTLAPSSTPWYEPVKGSQGLELKLRMEHVYDELIRIYRYQAKGDLATFKQLFDYLEKREKGSLVLGSTEKGSNRFNKDFPSNLGCLTI